MDWIFDHLQLVIVISGAIAYWLNQRRREKEGQDADYDGDGIPDVRVPRIPQADALEEEERTRRIQEEIRRKIMERRGGAAPVPPAVPVPVDTYREQSGWREEAPRPLPVPVAPPPLDETIMARQRALQEQIEALEVRRAATRARAGSPVFPSAPATVRKDARRDELPALVTALRPPHALRQAVILREVLGPPVSMR